MLSLCFNYAVERDRHMDVRFKIATGELCDRAKRKAIDKYENKQIRLERYVQATCSLSERICAEYVKQHLLVLDDPIVVFSVRGARLAVQLWSKVLMC